ncbi:PTS glucose transporter subunit IIA [Peptostreptococcaceae bacterium OttesenSCG-928-C18]|nr:PTS glucose transporter subunit IIA [Peptostreptococcaceae bacterium OttesenSCG-928-C18]
MLRGLFSKQKKRKKNIFAIQAGSVLDITKVPDVMFSDKILGDGVAIIPEGKNIYSPVTGMVDMISNTLHAYGITTKDGVDILIHIGLETVELKGQGFKPKVKVGDKVRAGDLLVEVDFEMLKEKGYKIITPVIITNMDSIKEIEIHLEKSLGKNTVIIEYVKR